MKINKYDELLDLYKNHQSRDKENSIFFDVFKLIDQVHSKLSNHDKSIESILRRLYYIETTANEIEYLIELSKNKNTNDLLKWTTNKIESFITTSAELTLFIVRFYFDVNPRLRSLSTKSCVFENIFDLIRGEISFFDTENDAIYSLILVDLRNCISHSNGINVNFENKEINIKSTIHVRKIRKYGVLKDYLETKIISGFNGKKYPKNWYCFFDPNFKFVTWWLRMQKNAKFYTRDFRIYINISSNDYLNKTMKIFIYQLCSRFFKNLLKDIA